MAYTIHVLYRLLSLHLNPPQTLISSDQCYFLSSSFVKWPVKADDDQVCREGSASAYEMLPREDAPLHMDIDLLSFACPCF